MALLNSKFDTPRGYPNGSAMAIPFDIKKTGSPLVPVTLAAGKLVTQELQGSLTVVDLATTPNLTSASPIDVYLVVEGNDDYSGEFTGKCATVKPGTGIAWKTDDFATGTYTPGTPVTFDGGQVAQHGTVVSAAADQIIGFVLYDDSATDGTITISA